MAALRSVGRGLVYAQLSCAAGGWLRMYGFANRLFDLNAAEVKRGIDVPSMCGKWSGEVVRGHIGGILS